MNIQNNNYFKCKQHFIDIGEWEKFDRPVMHHVLPCWRHYNLDRYLKWDYENGDIILMESSEHRKLHSTGREWTEEQREHHRQRFTGEGNNMYGEEPWCKGLTKETDERVAEISRKLTGRVVSNESKRKNSESHKGKPGLKGEANGQFGKHWYTNGTESIMCFEGDQPNGWVRGRHGQRGEKNNRFGKGDNYLCIETGKIIHNSIELKEYVNNNKAGTSNLASASRTGKIRYGYHWKIIKD